MDKRERHFERIRESKERLGKHPNEWLLERFRFGSLTKEGAIAIRELLVERGVPIPGDPKPESDKT
jgi:hypothetical protein